MKLLPKILPQNDQQRRAKLESELIHIEAEIGAKLFGPVPKGHIRQFFCLDEHTWVWHEEWTENGEKKIVTTRYTLRPNGVLKSQREGQYEPLSESEARNLYRATTMYRQKVEAYYQQQLNAA